MVGPSSSSAEERLLAKWLERAQTLLRSIQAETTEGFAEEMRAGGATDTLNGMSRYLSFIDYLQGGIRQMRSLFCQHMGIDEAELDSLLEAKKKGSPPPPDLFTEDPDDGPGLQP